MGCFCLVVQESEVSRAWEPMVWDCNLIYNDGFDSLLPFMKKEDEAFECCAECGKNAVFRWYRVTEAHVPKSEFWICSACNTVNEDIQVRHSIYFRRLREKLQK